MLPGFTRTAAHPASMAAKTYFGWKWMSAMTGICDLRAMAGSASASSWLGQATRTMSQPDAVSSAICWRVALISVVGVVVMDCTDTGASPPTSSFPTRILRLTRRGAMTGGGSAGIPRETDMRPAYVGTLGAPDRSRGQRGGRSAGERGEEHGLEVLGLCRGEGPALRHGRDVAQCLGVSGGTERDREHLDRA